MAQPAKSLDQSRLMPVARALPFMKSRPLQTGAGIILAAVFMGFLWALITLSGAINNSTAYYRGHIDLVIAAKDDPLHILKTVLYQTEEPGRNISGATARITARHPQIKLAIPLSFADNFKGYRIVGTDEHYMALHGAVIDEGTIWQKPMQAVAGARTGLKTGDKFSPVHGFSSDGAIHDHPHHVYEVAGTLAPTGLLIDSLILTPVQSVYEIHNVIIEGKQEEHNHAPDHSHDHDHEHSHEHDGHHHDEEPHSHGAESINHEVTAMLIQTFSSQTNFAHEINRTSNLTAAAPDREINNLRRRLGLGAESFTATVTGLSALTLLMILATLAAHMTARGPGQTPPLQSRLNRSFSVLSEGVTMGMLAGLAGLGIGRGISLYLLAHEPALQGLVAAETLTAWGVMDIKIILWSACMGLDAALIPALMPGRVKK